MTTVLQVCQDAADELSLARPDEVVGVTDDNTAQKLLRHLTVTIKDLARRHEWANLQREYTFSTADSTEGYALPSMFLRLVPDSLWNRTRRFRFGGPLSSADWQAYKASLTSMAFQTYRIRGTGTTTLPQILIAPTPAAIETIAFEYVSKAVGIASGAEIAAFTADGNTFLWDSELLTLGTIWRYKKAEGQDYSEEFRTFELAIQDMIKADKGGGIVSMDSSLKDRTPTPARVPDTLVFS